MTFCLKSPGVVTPRTHRRGSAGPRLLARELRGLLGVSCRSPGAGRGAPGLCGARGSPFGFLSSSSSCACTALPPPPPLPETCNTPGVRESGDPWQCPRYLCAGTPGVYREIVGQYRDAHVHTHTRVPVCCVGACKSPAQAACDADTARGLGAGCRGNDAAAGLRFPPSSARLGGQLRPRPRGLHPHPGCRGGGAGGRSCPAAGSRCPVGSRLLPGAAAPGAGPKGRRTPGEACASPPNPVPAAPGLAARLPAGLKPCALRHAGSQRRRSHRAFLLPHKTQEFRALTRQCDNMKCRLQAPVALGNERLAVASQRAHS